jgi:hypothetical protein
MQTYILRDTRTVEPQSAQKGSVLTFCTFSVGDRYFVMRCRPEGTACLAFRSLDFPFLEFFEFSLASLIQFRFFLLSA